MRADAEVYGIDRVSCPAYRDRILDQFTGPAYGWMWPFPSGLHRWYDQALTELTNQHRVSASHRKSSELTS